MNISLLRAAWPCLRGRFRGGVRGRIRIPAAALAVALSLAAGSGLTAALLAVSGYPPAPALSSLLSGAFGGAQEWAETVSRAVPLVLTALGTAVAYKARLWSVGQEGQLVIGAIVAYAAAQRPGGADGPLAWLLPLAAGAAGGALFALLPAWCKARRGVSEIISTVLLNYVAVYVLNYVIAHVCVKAQSTYLQSDSIPAAAMLPVLRADSPLNAGLLVAAAATLGVALLLSRGVFGFELQAFGSNPEAARFKGIDGARTSFAVFALSGALCGLCGAVQLLGSSQRLSMGVATGAGYAGIIVAMLVRLNPWGVCAAALLFGALDTGSGVMQMEAGVPSTLAKAIQALLLMCFLVGEWSVQRSRARRVRHA